MSDQQVLEVLAKVGAVITDSHIVYTSGMHGSAYINKDAIYPELSESYDLAMAIALHFVDDNIDVILGPAIGGALLARDVAFQLKYLNLRGFQAKPVYAEKSENDDGFVIKRGYEKLVAGARVLLVDDIVNQGGTAKKLVEAVKPIAGKIVGLGVVCNRGDITATDLGVENFFALSNIKLDAWPEAECPLCKQGVPINIQLGKGKEFLARRK